MERISKAQNELLSAMKNGTRVHFCSGLHAYAFRTDNMKTVTNTAFILERLGLVERTNFNHIGCEFKPKE